MFRLTARQWLGQSHRADAQIRESSCSDVQLVVLVQIANLQTAVLTGRNDHVRTRVFDLIRFGLARREPAFGIFSQRNQSTAASAADRFGFVGSHLTEVTDYILQNKTRLFDQSAVAGKVA